jgi:DNA polymerase-2
MLISFSCGGRVITEQQNKALGKTLKYQHKGWISYVITVNGPAPIDYLVSQIHYEYNIVKQIELIAEGVLLFIGVSFKDLTRQQTGLF